MPNWCNSSIRIVGDKEEIADLYQKLQSLHEREEPLVENGFGNLYLGCVVSLFDGDPNKIECRGEIEFMEQNGNHAIEMVTMTAWGPMPEVWDFVFKQYPSMKQYWRSEEGGMCLYFTNDVDGDYFPEKYVIIDFVNGTDYADDDQDLFDKIAERIEVESIKNFEELNIYLELFNEDHPDDGIYYHQVKTVQQTKYLSGVVAAFRTRSRLLRIYQNKTCILNERVDSEEGDDTDYWSTIHMGDRVLDVNLHEELDYSEPSLAAYPVVNNEVDCSTWENIKLKVLPI